MIKNKPDENPSFLQFEVDLTNDQKKQLQKSLTAMITASEDGDMKNQNLNFLDAVRLVHKCGSPRTQDIIAKTVMHVKGKVAKTN